MEMRTEVNEKHGNEVGYGGRGTKINGQVGMGIW